MEDNYAVVLDYGTGEIVILDIKNIELSDFDSCEILLAMADEQNLISSSSDCHIMCSTNITIRREKLK